MLSCLSVNKCPDSRLRLWCSTQYLRISPLHWVFRYPLHHSSLIVIMAIPKLSSGIFTTILLNRLTHPLRPVIPNNARPFVLPRLLARSLPGLLLVLPSSSSHLKELYNSKTFFITRHGWVRVASIAQYSLTAASRRSLDRVSVPMWLIVLSDQL